MALIYNHTKISIDNHSVTNSLVFYRICEVVFVKVGFDEIWRLLTEGVLCFICLKQTYNYSKQNERQQRVIDKIRIEKKSN